MYFVECYPKLDERAILPQKRLDDFAAQDATVDGRRSCRCRKTTCPIGPAPHRSRPCSRRETGSRLPPLRETKREAGGRAPDGEPSQTPATKAHQPILDFQKNSSLMIWSPERWSIPPWSLRSPARLQQER